MNNDILIILLSETPVLCPEWLKKIIDQYSGYGRVLYVEEVKCNVLVIANSTDDDRHHIIYLSVDLFGFSFYEWDYLKGFFKEKDDFCGLVSMLCHLSCLSTNFGIYLNNIIRADVCEDHLFVSKYSRDIDLILYFLLPCLRKETPAYQFIYLTVFRLISPPNISSKLSYKVAKTLDKTKDVAQQLLPELKNRHKKILKKIYHSLFLNDELCDVRLSQVFSYVFLEMKKNKTEGHIKKLCHLKEISNDMIEEYCGLVDIPKINIFDSSKIKYLYLNEKHTGTLSVASSVSYLLDNEVSFQKICGMTRLQILAEEQRLHRNNYFGSIFLPANIDAVFESPYKNDMPGTIEFINNQKELNSEGQEMKHCVANYGYECLNGHISIYRFFGHFRGTLAICNKTGSVIEFYGKGNSRMSTSDRLVVDEWLKNNN